MLNMCEILFYYKYVSGARSDGKQLQYAQHM